MNKRLLVAFLLIGIGLRLLVALFLNHDYDTFRIVALAKSVVDTGGLGAGFFKIGTVQLYGLMYYQVIAVWMRILSLFHIIDLRYLYDTAGYTTGRPDYMYLFPTLGFELYQMAVVKMVQFFWDIPLLLGILAIARQVGVKQRHWLVLFWAVDPLLLHTGYVLLQSDVAMMAFLVCGIYAAMKSHGAHITSQRVIWGILSFVLLGGGAVVKQMPLLLVPFLLVILSRSVKEFLLYCGAFFASYYLFAQPWTPDASLIREHFLVSEESLALFNFSLNSFNVFFGLYILLFLFFMANRRLFASAQGILSITLLVLSVIFVSEEGSNLYVQFMIWPLPFLEILALQNKKYALFIAIPFIGFVKRAIEDRDVFLGALALTFGAPFHHPVDYIILFQKYGNIKLIVMLLLTLFTIGFGFLAYSIIKDIQRKESMLSLFFDTYLRWLSPQRAFGIIAGTTFLFAIVLVSYVQQSLLLTEYTYVTNSGYDDSHLHKASPDKPFTVQLSNPNHHKITGVDIMLGRGAVISPGSFVVTAYDNKRRRISQGTIDDFLISDKPNTTFIPFQRSFTNNFATITLTNTTVNNVVYVITGDRISGVGNGDTPRNDQFYQRNEVSLSHNQQLYMINIRGAYTLGDMYHNASWQLAKKPSIMRVYLIFAFLSCIAGIALILIKTKKT